MKHNSYSLYFTKNKKIIQSFVKYLETDIKEQLIFNIKFFQKEIPAQLWLLIQQ